MIEKFHNQEDGNIGISLGHSRLLRQGYIRTTEIMDGNNDQILIAHRWKPKNWYQLNATPSGRHYSNNELLHSF